MRVIPKEGLTIIDHESHMVVPPEGIDVRDTDLYWVRRIRDGDVTKYVEPPPPEGGEGDGSGVFQRRGRREA